MVKISQKLNTDALASILVSINNISDMLIKYQNGKNKLARDTALTLDNSLDKLNTGGKISLSTFVDATLSSCSSKDFDLAKAFSRYFKQRDNEINKDLTYKFLTYIREAFSVRVTIDSYNWDYDLRSLLKILMAIGVNVNALFRREDIEGEENDEHKNKKDEKLTKEEKDSERRGEKAKKYKLS